MNFICRILNPNKIIPTFLRWLLKLYHNSLIPHFHIEKTIRITYLWANTVGKGNKKYRGKIISFHISCKKFLLATIATSFSYLLFFSYCRTIHSMLGYFRGYLNNPQRSLFSQVLSIIEIAIYWKLYCHGINSIMNYVYLRRK